MNHRRNLQYGVSITEFIIIAPLILFIGLAGIQYGLIYAARLNVTYAAYEAVRAGAIYNADPARIQNAFFKGMVPYFATPGIHLPGNVHIQSLITGTNPNIAQIGIQGTALKELIKKTESAFVHIHMVNPSKASFDDWNDPRLATAYKIKTGQTVRIIPNDNLDKKSDIKPKSKQNIQDANVLKLRFVYGYEPRIPLMKNVFSSLTSFFSSDRDAANIRMLAAGRIPIVVDISAQMLSPPIEGGLPTNTVNRNGYIVGEDLIERLTGNQAMQWQVGQKPVDLLDGITDSAEQSLISNFENDISNFQGISDLGTQLAGGLLGDNSPTGHAGSSTDSILGDTNNLVSCSSGQTITNFY